MEMLEQIADAFVPILCLLITAGGGKRSEHDRHHGSAADCSRSGTGKRSGRNRRKNGIRAGETRTTRKPGGRNPAGHFFYYSTV